MSAQIFPADTTNVLADDFVSLDHWSEYGSTSSDYRLAPEMSLGHGGSLYIPPASARLVRPTAMEAGRSYLLTCWAHPVAGETGVPRIQLADAKTLDETSHFSTQLLRGLNPGWNRLAVTLSIPDGWPEVWLRLARLSSGDGGGWFHGLRITRINESEDTQ